MESYFIKQSKCLWWWTVSKIIVMLAVTHRACLDLGLQKISWIYSRWPWLASEIFSRMILHASYTDVVGSNCIVFVTFFSTMLIRRDSVAMLRLCECLCCNITWQCTADYETLACWRCHSFCQQNNEDFKLSKSWFLVIMPSQHHGDVLSLATFANMFHAQKYPWHFN
jgi:hypothetical protein